MSLQITKQKAKEVRLGTYPYTYARISCMKTTLLKKEDYARLMKMTPNEIIEFLQETTYRKEINELAIKYSGTQLVEIALNRNLEDVFAKLRRISKPELVR
ncbi:V-type ATPase subunit, partial [Candidatus Woesearchaeota archaeon]|nr:V-type ATPase subunit [Candidatus Woesearchaeota archaeon]